MAGKDHRVGQRYALVVQARLTLAQHIYLTGLADGHGTSVSEELRNLVAEAHALAMYTQRQDEETQAKQDELGIDDDGESIDDGKPA